MPDAASSGLPIVVSNKVREVEHVHGNGRRYEENDVERMVTVLIGLGSPADPLLAQRSGGKC